MVAALYGTGIRPGDRFFCPSSPAWGHGLWHGTLAPLALGVTTGAYAGKFDAGAAAAGAAGAPLHQPLGGGHALPDDAELGRGARAIATAIHKLSFTGEPIDSETARLRRGRPSAVPVCSMYGTTEIGVILVDYPGARGLRGQAGLARQAGPGRAASRCSDPTAGRCAAGRDRRDEGLAARRLVRRPRTSAASTRTATSSTAAAPTTSSSRPAGR